jgi:DNA-directed RNA polymerase subunit RPC12/RpoP
MTARDPNWRCAKCGKPAETQWDREICFKCGVERESAFIKKVIDRATDGTPDSDTA